MELKVECLNLARYSPSAPDYKAMIAAVNLPAELNFNSFEEAMTFLRTHVHNAMLQLLKIRRELQEENKIRTIDSLF